MRAGGGAAELTGVACAEPEESGTFGLYKRDSKGTMAVMSAGTAGTTPDRRTGSPTCRSRKEEAPPRKVPACGAPQSARHALGLLARPRRLARATELAAETPTPAPPLSAPQCAFHLCGTCEVALCKDTDAFSFLLTTGRPRAGPAPSAGCGGPGTASQGSPERLGQRPRLHTDGAC